MENSNFAYSLKTERVREEDFPYNGEKLTCTTDLLSFVKKLQSADVEKMIILYLDNQNSLIGIQVMTGTINSAVVYPREVIKHALLSMASAIILVHNHPSNVVRPSDADIRITNTIKEACKSLDILVHDHVIIGETTFFSFREEGLM